MLRFYRRLSFQDRVAIYFLLKQKRSLRSIAREIGFHPSTISRELKRNISGKLYFPNVAHHKAIKRHFKSQRKLDKYPKLKQAVFKALRKQWSPEQISNHLKKVFNDPTMQVSTETLYTYLYVLPRGSLRKELLSHLRQFRTRRKKRGKHHIAHRPIPELISIHERPAEVEQRTVPGHWEGDLIMGPRHNSALGTLVERTSRLTLLIPLTHKDATAVRRAFARRIRYLPKQLKGSITYDRGGEMAQHKLFTQQTKMKVYFADPHSPWQRGTNENTNGLIRQYFPKGTDFKKVTAYQIKKVQNLLNERPRKVLDWQSPKQVMYQLLR